jgi:hypothetical protein
VNTTEGTQELFSIDSDSDSDQFISHYDFTIRTFMIYSILMREETPKRQLLAATMEPPIGGCKRERAGKINVHPTLE